MRIGIDASRAFISQRTGIEEYSYQVINHLRKELQDDEVFLYIQKNQKIDFDLPPKWKVKIIKMPRLWTQVGLSFEMLFHPIDVLFVPAHIVPLIHPKNTVVTVHGLEFEVYPEGYSFLARMYMRWSIKMSCRWAKTVIAVSENTKKDLVRLYGVREEKIEVVYEGISSEVKSQKSKFKSESQNLKVEEKYLLFIGRLEKRKNIEGILDAYKILKEKYDMPHNLVLAGRPGFGFDIIKLKIDNLLKIENCKLKIASLGYVNESSKWRLLSNADIFLFPTLYEGFGLPVLEAQSVGVPVVASNNSSIPEIMGQDVETQNFASVLVDPKSPESIAEAVYELISNPELKNDIIKQGYENIKRFSWKDCSFRVSKVLRETNGKKQVEGGISA